MTGISNIKTLLRGAFGAAIVAAALLLPAQALAQSNDCSQARSDPSAAQYCPQSEVLGVSGGSEGGPTVTSQPTAAQAAVTPAESGSTLPFTGLDVGVLLLAALVLGGTGLALRRFTASPASKE